MLTPARALAADGSLDRARLAHQAHRAEIQALEAQNQWLKFQLRQQQLYEQNRQAVQQPPIRPEIPVMRPSCRVSPYGSTWLATCR